MLNKGKFFTYCNKQISFKIFSFVGLSLLNAKQGIQVRDGPWQDALSSRIKSAAIAFITAKSKS